MGSKVLLALLDNATGMSVAGLLHQVTDAAMTSESDSLAAEIECTLEALAQIGLVVHEPA